MNKEERVGNKIKEKDGRIEKLEDREKCGSKKKTERKAVFGKRRDNNNGHNT